MHAQHENTVRCDADALAWSAPPVLGDFDDEAAAITVMVASEHAPRHAAWLSWMAWEPGLELAGGPVTDPARLAEALDVQRPQVLLLEAAMLDRLGLAALRALARSPHLHVLLVAEEAGRDDVSAVLRHRFDGVLSASSPTHLCLKAIRAVSAGELWLSRRLMAEFISESAGPRRPVQPRGMVDGDRDRDRDRDRDGDRDGDRDNQGARGPKALTRRERQVVARLHQGSSNKEIARELGIVEDTVKKHLKSVYAKLGVRRRAMVILQASG